MGFQIDNGILVKFIEDLSDKNIIIPNSIKSISKSAFAGCSNIQSVEIPDCVEFIGEKAFHDCIALKRVRLPINTDYIGEKCFEGSGLTELTIPSGTKMLGWAAFRRCLNLETINIEEGVEKLVDCCFEQNPKLHEVYIPESVTDIGEHTFMNDANITLIVKKDSYAEKYAKQNGIRYRYSDGVKIVVVSDSHGNYRNFSQIVKKHKDCNLIIHAGDGEQDIEDLAMYERDLSSKVVFVGGNCDIHGIHERTKTVEIGGIRIFVAHGDRYEVKTDKTIIANAAKSEGCQVAVFGHSHIRFCENVEGVFLLNPGSCDIQGDKTAPSYALLYISDGHISAEINNI